MPFSFQYRTASARLIQVTDRFAGHIALRSAVFVIARNEVTKQSVPHFSQSAHQNEKRQPITDCLFLVWVRGLEPPAS